MVGVVYSEESGCFEGGEAEWGVEEGCGWDGVCGGLFLGEERGGYCDVGDEGGGICA